MTCDEAKILLSDYLGQTLGEAQEIAFEAHLAACDSCHAETERLGTLWRGLSLLPAHIEEPGPNVRSRFYETLGAYRQGLDAAPRGSIREKIFSLWPKQAAWQMAVSFALLVVGVGVGFQVRQDKPQPQVAGSELAQLRGEVSSMRQMVALALMQEQSAGERLRGVGWANRVGSSDTEVLSALLTAVNQDSNVNVRLAAVDALHAFGTSPVTRTAILQSIGKQTTPMVQIALIDLMMDLKMTEALPSLRALASDKTVDEGVRQRATWALEKLK